MVHADLSQTLGNVWWQILSVGNLSFLGLSDGSAVVALTRLLIGFLVFTIIFALLVVFAGGGGHGGAGGHGGGSLSFLNRGQAAVVAAVIAVITAVFIPAAVLLAVGSSWGVAVALILIGGPIVGFFFLMWNIPGRGRTSFFLKLVICMLLFWVLSAVKVHVVRLAGGV